MGRVEGVEEFSSEKVVLGEERVLKSSPVRRVHVTKGE